MNILDSTALDEITDEVFAYSPVSPKKDKPFTFIDLFSGIGGFHQALKELGG